MSTSCFRHEACFYDGRDGFVDATLPFVRAGVEAGEAVLVVVDRDKGGDLRDALMGDADAVDFADMAEVGRNPAWIIPAWVRFVDDAVAAGRVPRGIGEPIDAGRDAHELRECHVHESLLNAVFAGADGFSLLCPYDTATLADDVLVEAMRTHPLVDDARSPLHRPPSPGLLGTAMPAAPPFAPELRFDTATLRRLRRRAAEVAVAAGLDGRADDVVVAVNELATNSTRHGGGGGVLRHWRDPADGSLVLEVEDAGRITNPLVGRLAPTVEQVGGRGVWMCNQIADLVQVRSTDAGTTVRLRFSVPARAT